jgi:hypothetical protein
MPATYIASVSGNPRSPLSAAMAWAACPTTKRPTQNALQAQSAGQRRWTPDAGVARSQQGAELS